MIYKYKHNLKELNKPTLQDRDSQAFKSGYSDNNSIIAEASLIEGTVSIAIKSHFASIRHSSLGLCQSFKYYSLFSILICLKWLISFNTSKVRSLA